MGEKGEAETPAKLAEVSKRGERVGSAKLAEPSPTEQAPGKPRGEKVEEVSSPKLGEETKPDRRVAKVAATSTGYSGSTLDLTAAPRRELVAELSGEGMSTRAIADVVGVSDWTVRHDVRGNLAPGEEGAPTTTGLDGKTYTRPPVRPETELAIPVRLPLAASAACTATSLEPDRRR